VEVPRGTLQDAVEAEARSQENVSRHLEKVAVRRVIFVPDRLLNFVVG
jgi:leucyl-tRNA synthetase